MAREWKTLEEGTVEVDPRNLKMQSAQAIRSVLDALVELVTNSDDAYGEAGDDKGKILIEVTRERGERSGIVVVKDRAGGLTIDEMKQKILKYGAFLAGVRTRGYMEGEPKISSPSGMLPSSQSKTVKFIVSS